MRPAGVFAAVALWIPALVLAQESATAILTSLPNCAIACLSTNVLQSPCSLTDVGCVCRNETLQGHISACVLQSCTIKQALTARNVTDTACGVPIRDKTRPFVILSDTFAVATVLFVIQRFAIKFYVKIGIGLDDWFALITTLVGIPNSVLNVAGTAANGLGKDVWTLPFSTITRFGLFFYVVEMNYFLLVALLKLSLLFFYLRIFPSKTVRRLLWATVVITCCFGVAFVVAGIFVCQPISYYWTRWDGEHQGHCINLNALGWSNSAISISLDCWMLAIPLSQLRDLSLDVKKKIGVGLMFCIGTFVTVVSVLRLRSLVRFGTSSQNPTWDYYEVALWSTLEINIGIICTCLPSLRLLLVRLFPRVLGSAQYYSGYGNPSRRSRAKSHRESRGGIRTGNIVTSQSDRAHGASLSKGDGITLERTYAVEFGDNDEMELVGVRDVDIKSSNSGSSV